MQLEDAEHDGGAVLQRELVEARGDGARLLQQPAGALDHVAATVHLAAEPWLPPRPVRATLPLVLALGDDRVDEMLPQPRPHAGIAVALVAGDGRGPLPSADAHGVQHGRHVLGLVRLAGAHLDGQRQARAVGHEVDLRPEAAAAAAQRVVTRLVGYLRGDAHCFRAPQPPSGP